MTSNVADLTDGAAWALGLISWATVISSEHKSGVSGLLHSWAMPNTYGLVETKGALKLERHWVADPKARTRPPSGGGGTGAGLPGQSTAGRVSLQWSARSRRNMRFEFSALPWELLGPRPAMITLTYPGEWDLWVPDARTFVRHREALKERWRRKFSSPIGVWVVEFQRRGAPHLHMYLGLPEEVSDKEYWGLQDRTMRRHRLERELGPYEARKRMRAPSGEFATWLRTAWWEVVGSELSTHHGRGTDIATAFFSDEAERTANRARVAEYFWRESGKWAQKQTPEGFGPLKFYGRWGQAEGFKPNPSHEELSEAAAYEVRRVLRKLVNLRLRQAYALSGKKPPKGAGRSRGRDGMTVFDIDGEAWGPRLRAWAEVCAADKETERAGVEPVVWYRGSKDVLRALRELPAPEPDEFDPDTFDPDWMDPPEFDPDEWEARQEEMVDRFLRDQELAEYAATRTEEERARRREHVRAQDRERVARRRARSEGGERRQPPPHPDLPSSEPSGAESG